MKKTKKLPQPGQPHPAYKWATLNVINNCAGLLTLCFFFCTVFSNSAYAQDGNAGITEATMRIKSYFATGTTLMYAIGSVVGLVGAVKVFQKWNSGDQDTGKVAAAWFGSCVFLVIVATVLKSFFGI